MTTTTKQLPDKCANCERRTEYRGDKYCSVACHDGQERPRTKPVVTKPESRPRGRPPFSGHRSVSVDKITQSKSWRQRARESQARITARYGVKLPDDERETIYKT